MIHIAYSLSTGRVRGWTVFTAQEIASGAARKAKPGEGILSISPEQYGDLNALQALVTQATGKTPSNDRHIMVNLQTGKITGAYIADPACDDPHPGCGLYVHATADETWTVDLVGKTVTAPTLTTQEISTITAAKQARGVAWTSPAQVIDALIPAVANVASAAKVA